jgi:hypothetical protein
VPRIAPFAAHHERDEQWFDEHTPAYLSELLALRSIVPVHGRGLEIGVGTARFAAPLGVRFGVDPAVEMLRYAAGRGTAVRFAFPSAMRGIPGVGWFNHCAATGIVIATSVTAVSKSFIPSLYLSDSNATVAAPVPHWPQCQ